MILPVSPESHCLGWLSFHCIRWTGSAIDNRGHPSFMYITLEAIVFLWHSWICGSQFSAVTYSLSHYISWVDLCSRTLWYSCLLQKLDGWMDRRSGVAKGGAAAAPLEKILPPSQHCQKFKRIIRYFATFQKPFKADIYFQVSLEIPFHC